MSIELIKTARSIGKEHLSASQKNVLTCMLGYADDFGRKIFPSIATISTESSVCRSTVKAAIKYLVNKGFLTKVEDGDVSAHHSNKYMANLFLLTELSSYKNAKKLLESIISREEKLEEDGTKTYGYPRATDNLSRPTIDLAPRSTDNPPGSIDVYPPRPTADHPPVNG